MGNDFRLTNLPQVPYQPDDGSAMAGAIDKISGAYRQRKAREEEQRRWELERERQLGKDAQFERQNDLVEQGRAATEARAQREFEIKQDDREAGQVKDVYGLLAAGRGSEAEAMAGAREYVDPKTGQRRAIKVDKGAEGGGQDFSGFMSTLPIWGKNGAESMPQDGQPMPMGRAPSITTPGGQRMEIDPAEGEAFKDQEAEAQAQRALAAAAKEPDPTLRMAWMREAERARSRMSGAGAQGLRNRESQEDAQAHQTVEGDKNRAMRVQLKGMGGGGTGDKAQRTKLMNEKTGLEIEGKYSQEVQKVLMNRGFKELNTQAVKFSDMAATIAGAQDSGALSAIASGQFVKMAQGGTGVISDSDMKVFWERIGGLGVRGEQAFRNAMDGKMGPEKQAEVASAVKELEGKARGNVNSIGSSIEATLRGLPGGEERIPRFLQTYVPEYKRTAPEAGVPKSDPGRRAKLVEWAKQNPNDPRSKAILQAK